MAHRGNSMDVPENTMEAFKDAVDLKVDVIETDVRLTKDDQFVFLHDGKLNRTTNAKGKVQDYTLAELKRLDAGYSFENENGEHPFRGKGFKIQTVDEIIEAFPRMRFNMDIKSKDPRAPSLLARKLESLGIKDGNDSRVMVGSFWQKQIERFRSASGIPTSASIKDNLAFRSKARKWQKQRARGKISMEGTNQESVFGKKLPYFALQIPERFAIITIINGPSFIEFAHAVGISVQVWTINERPDMERLLDWGVDGIFTDTPALLLDVLAKRGF